MDSNTVLALVGVIVALAMFVMTGSIIYFVRAVRKLKEPALIEPAEKAYNDAPLTSRQVFELFEQFGRLLHNSIPADKVPNFRQGLGETVDLMEKISDGIPEKDKPVVVPEVPAVVTTPPGAVIDRTVYTTTTERISPAPEVTEPSTT